MAEEPEFSDDSSAEIDEDGLELFYPSYRWSREQVTSDVLDFASKITAATAEYLSTVASRAKSENNFRVDQEDAADEARTQIESMTSTPTMEGPDA